MVHLVYCDNQGKKGERVLDKINSGTKIMVVRGAAGNQDKLNLTDKQKERWHKKCLCLVDFEGVQQIKPPLPFDHQGNMDDWLIIEQIGDVVVGTSIPYNYEKSRF